MKKSKIQFEVQRGGEVKVVNVERGDNLAPLMTDGTVLINVSTFCGKNESHKKARELVEIEAEKTRDDPEHEWESLRLSFLINFPKAGCKTLCDKLEKNLSCSLKGKVHDMIGKFDGIEPSVNFSFPATPSQFTDIKGTVIAFGESNNQDNIHFAYFLGINKPSDNTIADLPADVSCEIAWHLTADKPMNLDELKTWTDELGIFGLSLMCSGFDLLIYTTENKGKPILNGMPEKFQALRKKLEAKYKIVSSKTWYVGLSNYGNKEYGATHTYAEARQLLNAC